jgi:isopenicillin N synthase-like dioxygenase
MRSIAVGLGLDEFFFDKKIDQQCHNLRLLSYPPIKGELLQGDGRARAGAHSGKDSQMSPSMSIDSLRSIDYGSITLLFQDTVGGLEILAPAFSTQRHP